LLARIIRLDHVYVRRAMNSADRQTVAAAWLRLRSRLGAIAFRNPVFPTTDSPNLWIAGLLGRGHVYFDVGANAGETLSVAVARLGKSGEAHAFEPNPRTFANLSSLVRLAGWRNIRLTNAAVAAEAGEVTLFCPPSNPSSSLSRAFIAHIPDDQVSSVQCPAITLDSYWKQLGLKSLTLMKIDVEGAELPALRGSERMIESFRPYLVVEVTDSNARELAFGYRTVELLGYLMDRNFALFHMVGGRVHPLKRPEDWVESTHDVCAIPREKLEREEVRRLFKVRRPRTETSFAS
jgi:FkbM family methyltransferase